MGSFYKLLLTNDEFISALVDEQESPDFILQIDSIENPFSIEVCEILHPNRERGNEAQQPLDINKIIENKQDIWEQFKSTLQKKLTKNYGNNCALLIYHNIPASHISEYGYWINIVCANIKEWNKQQLIDLKNTTFQKIYIINSSVDEVISVYPEYKVYCSEYKQYFEY